MVSGNNVCFRALNFSAILLTVQLESATAFLNGDMFKLRNVETAGWVEDCH